MKYPFPISLSMFLVLTLLVSCQRSPQILVENTQVKPSSTYAVTMERPADSPTQVDIQQKLILATSTPTPQPPIAIIQPVKFPLEREGMEEISRSALEYLSFKVNGIYAIDQKIAFLFGSFEGRGNNNIRSALFRTQDGGQTWTEVMQSKLENEIGHVAFVQQGIGWASMTWNYGDILGTTFWGTKDYGKTWQEIPNVNSGHMVAWGLKFLDALNGQIIFLDITGNPNLDGVVIWSTKDGGNTWKESQRVLIPPSLSVTTENRYMAAYAEANGGRYGSHWGDCEGDPSVTCQAFGADGSEWTITFDEKTRYYVIRFASADETKKSIYRLPMEFDYQNGDFIGQ